jgi:hypothetical protein
MRTRFSSLLFIALSLALGAPAVHAANPFAGTYTEAYMDHQADGKAQYGTVVVSSTGAMTMTLTTYVGDGLNQQQVLHGTVSSTGAVKITVPGVTVSVKFLKQGGTVVGFTGSTSKGGVFVAVRKS